jgi:hypothetical protein
MTNDQSYAREFVALFFIQFRPLAGWLATWHSLACSMIHGGDASIRTNLPVMITV